MIRAWLIAVLAMTALHASAEVFTYIDAQGNRVYTDQPRGNAKRVPLATSNRMPANPQYCADDHRKKSSEQPPFHYDMRRVLVPEPDATIRSSAGELIVSITMNSPAKGPFLSLAAGRQGHGQPGVSRFFR